MSFILKIGAEQGFAFLVGLALVTIIQPDTTGGVVLLIATGIAATNVLITLLKSVFRGRERAAEEVARLEKEAAVFRAGRGQPIKTSASAKVFISYRREDSR